MFESVDTECRNTKIGAKERLPEEWVLDCPVAEYLGKRYKIVEKHKGIMEQQKVFL